MVRYVTILEAHVASSVLPDLARTFASRAASLPPEIQESYLLRSLGSPGLVRLQSFWLGREMQALETSTHLREQMAVFESLGIRPTLQGYEVVGHGVPVIGQSGRVR